MAIISSVLKLVNVGDTVKVENTNDAKKEDKSVLGADSEGVRSTHRIFSIVNC